MLMCVCVFDVATFSPIISLSLVIKTLHWLTVPSAASNVRPIPKLSNDDDDDDEEHTHTNACS